jgi:hypothetical protein
MRRPKGIKTRKSVAKRFKITGTGKVLGQCPPRPTLRDGFFDIFAVLYQMARSVRGVRALAPLFRNGLSRRKAFRFAQKLNLLKPAKG